MQMVDFSDEVWMWVHQKYGMSRIIQKFNSIKKMLLPCCYQQFSIGLMKKWMIGMKYEVECIKNMELVKSCIIWNKSKI